MNRKHRPARRMTSAARERYVAYETITALVAADVTILARQALQ
jgi:hypothetical protein